MKSIDIIIPVYYGNLNEIEESIKKQIKFYKQHLNNYNWKIIIGINGPNKNGIIDEAKRLCKKYKNVAYDYTCYPGKGNSIKKVFTFSKADIKAFMDVDLSTDLASFPELIGLVDDGGFDISSGSRYLKESIYVRKLLRTFISKVYLKVFVKWLLNLNYTDPQCGFKAVSGRVPPDFFLGIEDNTWFFETEMYAYANKFNYKIKEIPIKWYDHAFSGVNISKAIPYFIMKCILLKRRLKLS